MSGSNSTGITTAPSADSQTNYLTLIVIIVCVLIGMVLIVVISYFLKIKMKNKSKTEISRLKTVFKKTYVNKSLSVFSLKVSDDVSEVSAAEHLGNRNVNINNYFPDSNKLEIVKFQKIEETSSMMTSNALETRLKILNMCNTNTPSNASERPVETNKKVSLETSNIIQINRKDVYSL